MVDEAPAQGNTGDWRGPGFPRFAGPQYSSDPKLGPGAHANSTRKRHSAGKESIMTIATTSLAPARASLAIATLLWAGNFIVGRALRDDMTPLELNFWRWLIALAALLPFTAHSLWRARSVILQNSGYVVLLALTGVVVPHASVYAALASTSAVNALLLMSIAPLLIGLGDWAFFGQSLRARQWSGMGLAFAGAITSSRGATWLPSQHFKAAKATFGWCLPF